MVQGLGQSFAEGSRGLRVSGKGLSFINKGDQVKGTGLSLPSVWGSRGLRCWVKGLSIRNKGD